MRACKLGSRAAKLCGVVAVIVGLSVGSAGSAGASTDANYAFATTHGNFALTWGFPDSPFQVSFRTKTAVNVSFRVNGQSYGQGGFSVPAEQGPSLADPSAAYASSSFCQGCLTNAIAITVDVLSGPVSSVFAPTNAVAKDNYCMECNTLAADYTFVVAPGAVASLTPSGLSDLSSIASQLVADANVDEPSQILAGQVTSALGAIQTLLESPTELDPVGAPQAVDPVNGPQAAAVPDVQTQNPVQEFGEIQYSTAENG